MYCVEQLSDSMKQLITVHGVSKAFDLGEYRLIPVTHAAKGHGLLHMEHIINAILNITPFAMLKYKDMKDILIKLCLAFSDLKTKKETVESWASDVATQINVALSHLRRLKTEDKWRQRIANLTEEQIGRLQLLVESVESVCLPSPKATSSNAKSPTKCKSPLSAKKESVLDAKVPATPVKD